MGCTYRTLNDCEMQHNAEVRLFTRPSRIKVRITDVANTHFYVDDPGDSMENGSNGSTTLKQTAILRGNKGLVKIDPAFIRNR